MRVFRAHYQLSPNVDIKNELKQTVINIICYDKDGNAIKSVNSGDKGDIEDPENDNPGGGSGSGGSGSSGLGSGGGTSGGSSDEHD